MSRVHEATGAYRAADVSMPGEPVRHGVIGPGGLVCLDDRTSAQSALYAAAVLNTDQRFISPIDVIRKAA